MKFFLKNFKYNKILYNNKLFIFLFENKKHPIFSHRKYKQKLCLKNV